MLLHGAHFATVVVNCFIIHSDLVGVIVRASGKDFGAVKLCFNYHLIELVKLIGACIGSEPIRD